MDLIERIFGISPDHGSGVLEATLLILVLLSPIAISVLRARRRHAATPVVND
jgi:hypothetical protein